MTDKYEKSTFSHESSSPSIRFENQIPLEPSIFEGSVKESRENENYFKNYKITYSIGKEESTKDEDSRESSTKEILNISVNRTDPESSIKEIVYISVNIKDYIEDSIHIPNNN
tara:strand:- start:386 stop:724 length:339 start_codon:yes stop_codon:yes gene_type:complete